MAGFFLKYIKENSIEKIVYVQTHDLLIYIFRRIICLEKS